MAEGQFFFERFGFQKKTELYFVFIALGIPILVYTASALTRADFTIADSNLSPFVWLILLVSSISALLVMQLSALSIAVSKGEWFVFGTLLFLPFVFSVFYYALHWNWRED